MNDYSAKWVSWANTDSDNLLAGCVARLKEADGPADELGVWPTELWEALSEVGATRWALPHEFGGVGCDRTELLERYARVAEGSLTAALILTQHDAALRRLLPATDRPVARDWIARIAQGQAFTTVGISQLTTSRRLGTHALRATRTGENGYLLDGTIPWVTAAERADVLVTGAVTEDGQQLLIALPTSRPGITIPASFEIAALQASRTTEVACLEVQIQDDEILAGPSENVVASPTSAGTGGLETSALALGMARAAISGMITEASSRADLEEPIHALIDTWNGLWQGLQETACESSNALPSGQIRAQANAFVLRATQAYLTVRKGTGFLRSDPAQRWARQALFFLVWSCPSPVAQTGIRDLAGLCPS